MLRVGFNAYLLHAPGLRGWNRYAVNLLAALPAHDVRPLLYSTRPIHADHLARLPEGAFDVRVAPPMRYVRWEQRWLPGRCRTDGVDLLHSPFNYGLPVRCPVPRVLTLHDAIDALHDGARLPLTRRWAPSNLRRRLDRRLSRRVAAHVITVSEHAKRDLVDGLRLPAAKVTVAYEAADPTFEAPVSDVARAAVRATHGLRRPFVFYVGGFEPRKNVPFLVRAFADARLADVDLVLAGGAEVEGADVARLAGELGVGERVRSLGYVPDPELAALYAEALVFAYPSAYEGFGLPLVEAMAVGCPVLAARATSLPEILGTGGEAFALGDPAELTAWLRRLATEPALRADLVARARRRACDFSWRRAAAATVEVYRRVLAPRPAAVR
jgi:hypothetical protein